MTLQSGEVMPDESEPSKKKQFQMINGERVLVWTPFNPADLPPFDILQFLTKKETAAHYQLDQQKEVLCKSIKVIPGVRVRILVKSCFFKLEFGLIKPIFLQRDNGKPMYTKISIFL